VTPLLVQSRPFEGVLLLELNRPGAMNALNGELNAAITAAVREANRNDETKVIVLAGAGDRAFSAGADLKEMRGLSGPRLSRFIEATWEPCEALVASPIPSIAALHGHVLGGGAELALACDMRVGQEDLSFGFPEMTLGSLPGSGGLQRLPAITGRDRALEIVATGRRLLAAECLALGILTRHAKPGTSARSAALELAAAIGERPTEPLRALKAALALAGRPEAARVFHGLASASFQSAAGYRQNTQSFRDQELPK